MIWCVRVEFSDIGIVFKAECALCLGNAARGERRRARFFVNDVVCVDALVLFLLGVGGGIRPSF